MESFILLSMYLKSDVLQETFKNLQPFFNICEQDGIYCYRTIIILKMLFVLGAAESIIPSYIAHAILATSNAYIAHKYKEIATLAAVAQCLLFFAPNKKLALFISMAWMGILSMNIKSYEFILDMCVLLCMLWYAFEAYRKETQKLCTIISIELTLGWYICNLDSFNLVKFLLIFSFLFLAYIPLKPNRDNKYRHRLTYFYALIFIWVVYKFQVANIPGAQALEFETRNMSTLNKGEQCEILNVTANSNHRDDMCPAANLTDKKQNKNLPSALNSKLSDESLSKVLASVNEAYETYTGQDTLNNNGNGFKLSSTEKQNPIEKLKNLDSVNRKALTDKCESQTEKTNVNSKQPLKELENLKEDKLMKNVSSEKEGQENGQCQSNENIESIDRGKKVNFKGKGTVQYTKMSKEVKSKESDEIKFLKVIQESKSMLTTEKEQNMEETIQDGSNIEESEYMETTEQEQNRDEPIEDDLDVLTEAKIMETAEQEQNSDEPMQIGSYVLEELKSIETTEHEQNIEEQMEDDVTEESKSIDTTEQEPNMQEPMEDDLDVLNEEKSMETTAQKQNRDEPVQNGFSVLEELKYIESTENEQNVEEPMEDGPDVPEDSKYMGTTEQEQNMQEAMEGGLDVPNEAKYMETTEQEQDMKGPMENALDVPNEAKYMETTEQEHNIQEPMEDALDVPNEAKYIETTEQEHNMKEPMDDALDVPNEAKYMETTEQEQIMEEPVDDLYVTNEEKSMETEQEQNRDESMHNGSNVLEKLESIEITELEQDIKEPIQDGSNVLEDSKYMETTEWEQNMDKQMQDGSNVLEESKSIKTSEWERNMEESMQDDSVEQEDSKSKSEWQKDVEDSIDVYSMQGFKSTGNVELQKNLEEQRDSNKKELKSMETVEWVTNKELTEENSKIMEIVEFESNTEEQMQVSSTVEEKSKSMEAVEWESNTEAMQENFRLIDTEWDRNVLEPFIQEFRSMETAESDGNEEESIQRDYNIQEESKSMEITELEKNSDEPMQDIHNVQEFTFMETAEWEKNEQSAEYSSSVQELKSIELAEWEESRKDGLMEDGSNVQESESMERALEEESTKESTSMETTERERNTDETVFQDALNVQEESDPLDVVQWKRNAEEKPMESGPNTQEESESTETTEWITNADKPRTYNVFNIKESNSRVAARRSNIEEKSSKVRVKNTKVSKHTGSSGSTNVMHEEAGKISTTEYTDNKHKSIKTLKGDNVMRKRMYVDESVDEKYIAGEDVEMESDEMTALERDKTNNVYLIYRNRRGKYYIL